MYPPPFRWNVTAQEQLGHLLAGDVAPSYRGFLNQLRPCCSRVLAFAGDSNLVFIGRSPESVFDYLSGLLFDTSWCERLALLQFSMRYQGEKEIRQEYPEALPAICAYFEELDLHPAGLVARPRPVAFIDLVARGETFGRLIHLLHNWSQAEKLDWSLVRPKIRLVGITERKKNSPNTWRWQQHVEWRGLLAKDAIKNVSIPYALWDFLGNRQCKVTRSYRPKYWGNEENARPYHGEPELMALRFAYQLFETGRTPIHKEKFAALLVRERAMQQTWFRSLVGEIR